MRLLIYITATIATILLAWTILICWAAVTEDLTRYPIERPRM